MNIPKQAEIIEVCPRDGFQNVRDLIEFDAKVAIIRKLAEAGFSRIEVGSFVSPRAVPQMADTAAVIDAVRGDFAASGTAMVALVPNKRGVESALAAGVDEVTYVISVSSAHNKANVNRTPEESMDQFAELIGEYGSEIRFRLALATALGCPFGEEIKKERVLEMVRFGLQKGSKEIMIADTIGTADPQRTYDLMKYLVDACGPDIFVMHLHNTRGLALANTLVCLELGIRKFETAAGGLGGCPFAPGAAGNVATEDVLNMFDEMGIATGLRADPVYEAVGLIEEYVHAPLASSMARVHASQQCAGIPS